nr:hypothetical protein [uncultured Dongia sp.]
MSIATRFGSLAAVLAVVASAALATASPAAAKEHKIYNDRQAWAQVDQNRDGLISKKEWKWAEKHGYDRLNGVPKKHLTRAEYQSYLNEYLNRRYASYNTSKSWHKSQTGNSQGGWDQRDWDDDRYRGDKNPFIRRTDGRDQDRN